MRTRSRTSRSTPRSATSSSRAAIRSRSPTSGSTTSSAGSAAIPHVEIFRLGTRNLVTLPQRVTDDFVHMLRKHHPVFVNTHFNHPKECTAEAFEAARRLADAGCVIGNQMVLLKGVNDDPEIVKELNHKLLLMRIRPYYIYQCDLARGISHFRTPVETGIRDHRAPARPHLRPRRPALRRRRAAAAAGRSR